MKTCDVVQTASRRIVLATGVSAVLGACAGVAAQAQPVAEPGSTTAILKDANRGDREVGVRLFFPADAKGKLATIFISHGGNGSDRGESAINHIGRTLALRGFLALHVGHRPSANGGQHNIDRPKDVSFLIDSIADLQMLLPQGHQAMIDTSKMGHTGHSWGSYTSLALAGGRYGGRKLADTRLKAFAPISPVGVSQYGSYNNGPDDNTWSGIEAPVLTLIGGDEMDSTQSVSVVPTKGFRRQPFDLMTGKGDKILIIIPGQDHARMANAGSEAVKQYVAGTITDFFAVYLRGDMVRACAIGRQPGAPSGTTIEFKAEAGQGRLSDCDARSTSP